MKNCFLPCVVHCYNIFWEEQAYFKVSQRGFSSNQKLVNRELCKVVEWDMSELLKSCLTPNLNDALQDVTGEQSQIMESRTPFKTVQYCVVLRCANHVCGVLSGHGWLWTEDVTSRASCGLLSTAYCTFKASHALCSSISNVAALEVCARMRKSTARRKNRSIVQTARDCTSSDVCEMADILVFRKGQYSEY